MSDWWHGFFTASLVYSMFAWAITFYCNRLIRRAGEGLSTVIAMHNATHEALEAAIAQRDAWKAETERLRAFQKQTTGVTLT